MHVYGLWAEVTHLLNISKVYSFSLNMTMVYTYILIDSISKVYTYVLFDVVSVDGYLCTCILCTALQQYN
jgi:hypothetical protein